MRSGSGWDPWRSRPCRPCRPHNAWVHHRRRSIYAVGLIAMLGISAAYNVYPVCRTKWLLRRLDHSAIYVLIAATYTPFLATTELTMASAGLLGGLAGGDWRRSSEALAAGPSRSPVCCLYLLLGWAGAAAYPVMATLPSSTLC